MMKTTTTHIKTPNQMERTRAALIHSVVGPTGLTNSHDVKKCEHRPRVIR
jgi:hypothetical protein